LTLLYATLITASKSWRGLTMTPAISKELARLRLALAPATKEEVVA
jgi:hypothetical protein